MKRRAHEATSQKVLPGPERQGGPDELTVLGPPSDAAVEDAFGARAAQYRGVLYRMALRLTRCPRDAEDLLEETYRHARRALHASRTGTSPMAWLVRILYRAHIDRLKILSRNLGVPLSRLCGGRRAMGRLLTRHGPRIIGSNAHAR